MTPKEKAKEFIPYEQALDIKDLGFNEPCLSHYTQKGELKLNDMFTTEFSMKLKAPLYQQAFSFFRKKHELDSAIKCLYKSTIKVGYYFGIDQYKGVEYQMDFDDYFFKTYEEAQLQCLIKLIEICKSK